MMGPPRLAAVLLHHLLRSDSLAGDLAEEFAGGQSRLWYWRQVLAAISARAWSDIRDHKLATLGAIAVGFAFVEGIFRYVMFGLLTFDQWLFATGLVRWFYTHGYGLPPWAIWPFTSIMFAASGWMVGRLAGQARLGAVVAYTIFNECLACALGKWHFVYYPIRSHLILAILTIAVRPVPVLIAGLWPQTAESKRVVE
jgi:hypothetical protein